MGSDASIVQAARVSYGKGTKTPSDDRSLIRYLVRQKHTSPLEMCEIKLHIKAPIYVIRQIFRHRTASLNEISLRYSEFNEEFEESTVWRTQSDNNKQGSGRDLDLELQESLAPLEDLQNQSSLDLYNLLIERGVAREQARKVLPVSAYSEFYWKIDLHNCFHFLKLRLDSHAQKETRLFAEAIASIVKELFPVAYEAFEDYQLHSVHFSRQELAALYSLITGNTVTYSLSKREVAEFDQKVKKIMESR